MRKLNVTDGRTDGQTDGQTDGGRCNISRPGPSAPREIKIQVKHDLGRRLHGGHGENKIGGAHLGHVGIAMHA